VKLQQWLDPAGVWLLVQEVVIEDGAAELAARLGQVLA
jgi:hypothetical protein